MTDGPPDPANPATVARSRPPAAQWAFLFALVFIPIIAVVWIAMPRGVCACSPTPSPDLANPTPDLPGSPVEGVVVAVDAAGIGQVRGFTVRPTGVPFGFVLTLGTLENAAEFSPSHLAEHMASSEPIRAWYRLEGGVPVVYRLEDALG